MRALVLPLDNRPVTCLLPQTIAAIAGVTAVAPPRRLLGSLNRPAEPADLIEWIDSALSESRPDCLLLCLDSLIYGGLIASRRSDDSARTLSERVSRLSKWKQMAGKPILAQSSIMRISDNYDATEEKPYWAQFGRELFAWSEQLHRLSRGDSLARGLLTASEYKIPQAIREDYLKTRRRNFQINKQILNEVASGSVDVLIFGLDDSGEVGLNVLEKERLLAEAQERKLGEKVLCYPGADEVLCTLVARWLTSSSDRAARAHLIFSPPESAGCRSRYEGQTIADTITAQLSACGISTSTAADCDFVVVVHAHEARQGDHIRMPEEPDLSSLDTNNSVAHTTGFLRTARKPCVLLDVAYANGSDPALVEELFADGDLVRRLWGYAGWNTTGNSTGSALAMGVAVWFAQLHGLPAAEWETALRRCLFVRFADDWAYQSKVRRSLAEPVNGNMLEKLMGEHLSRISSALDYKPDKLTLTLPWARTFEIEIGIE